MRRSHMASAWMLAVAAVPAVLVAGAIFDAARTSVTPGISGSVTLEAWRTFAGDPATVRDAGFTVWIAVASALCAAAGGVVLFSALRRMPRRVAFAVLLIPIAVPYVTAAVLTMQWLGADGLLTRLVQHGVYDPVGSSFGIGIIITYAWKEAAFIAAILLVGLTRDLEDRETISRTLGLSRSQVYWHVTLPSIARPLIVATTLVAAFAIGALEIPALVGGISPQTLPQTAAAATAGDVLAGQSVAAANSLLTLVVSIALTLALAAPLLTRRMRWSS